MEKVRAFLKQIGFLQTWEEMAPVEALFRSHMDKGLAGEDSSLPMIAAYLTADSTGAKEQNVIVMDAGGTNLRVALMKLTPGEKPETLYSHKTLMPGKGNPISLEEFFLVLAREVLPVAEKADRLGFCFSFPCEIQPDLDGKILFMDKEVQVEGCEGALVGQGLQKALKTLGVANPPRVVILNDTVAALLGVLAEHPAECFSGYIGMILGTGFNCCYSEKSSRITKNAFLRGKEGHSIVNMEAGHFNALPITPADELLYSRTVTGNLNAAEKQISGAYQGLLLDCLVEEAIRAGLFSQGFGERFAQLEGETQSSQISAFVDMPAKPGRLCNLAQGGEDARVLFALCDALLERAAMLAVMQLTAIMDASGAGRDPLKPVAIAIEGTTYEKNERLRMKVRRMLTDYTEGVRGLYSRVYSTQDANMVGSAMAAAGV